MNFERVSLLPSLKMFFACWKR